MHSIESIQQLLEPLFPGLMGVRLVELAPERVVGELMVRAGPLHGRPHPARRVPTWLLPTPWARWAPW